MEKCDLKDPKNIWFNSFKENRSLWLPVSQLWNILVPNDQENLKRDYPTSEEKEIILINVSIKHDATNKFNPFFSAPINKDRSKPYLLSTNDFKRHYSHDVTNMLTHKTWIIHRNISYHINAMLYMKFTSRFNLYKIHLIRLFIYTTLGIYQIFPTQ